MSKSTSPTCRARTTRQWASVLALALVALALASCDLAPPSTNGLQVVVPPIGNGPGGGKFIVQCNGPVKSAAFDPIVYPGQSSVGHNHEFYGNRTINPDSTFASLSGNSTSCDDPGDTASYWHPTVYSNGVREVAPKSTFYYDSPIPGPVHSFPAGLEMIAGDHEATSPQDTNVVYWGCGNQSGRSVLNTPPKCNGGDLTVHIIFPNCWDGRHLDSADHQSHVAYSKGSCPASHPVAIPRLIMRIQFTGWHPDPGTLSLSSGSIDTMHADFFQAWAPAKLSNLVNSCINRGKHCSPATVIGL